MSSSRRGLSFWVSAWLPVAIGIALVVVESTRYFGSDRTSHPLRILFEELFGPIGDARWQQIHHYIRKSGHFFGYGALGLTWLRAWWMTLPRLQFFFDCALALLGTGLVACWDEWHQTFLANRTASPWDVLLDCCGASFVLLVTFVYLRLRRPGLLRERY